VRDCTWLLKEPHKFPNVRPENFRCCSDRTNHLPCGGYNCIAWAAGKLDRWWWPSQGDPCAFWPIPIDVTDPVTLDEFVKAFATEGYVACKGWRFENSFEKVAIFADRNQEPTHAARMLPNGVWTSKMGNAEDIQHLTLRVVEGRQYGNAVQYLKRQNAAFRKSLVWRLTQWVREWSFYIRERVVR
jgi:hypothetical protein